MLAMFTVVAVAGACSNDTPTDDTGTKKKFKIGLAEALVSVNFLATLDKAFKEKAEELGMEVEILDGEYKNDKMIENINTFINKDVDLIVVVPTDPVALNSAIERANGAGIPVFTVNAKVDPGKHKVALHVGASEEEFGKGLGDLLVQAVPDGGKYALLTGPDGAIPSVKRKAGMDEALKAHGSKYTNVATRPIEGWAKDKALAEVQDLLTKYKTGELDAIVCQGPMCTTGAEYAKKAGRDEVKFILGDYPKEVEEAIKAGTVYGTVNQSPVEQGRKAAEFAFKYLNKQTSELPANGEHKTSLPLITKANVATNPAEFS